MRFVYPFMLLGLVILPFLAWSWIVMRRRASVRLVRLSRQANTLPEKRQQIQIICVLLALALAIIALARPQWGTKDEIVSTRGRNLILLVDVSRSMLAADVYPNRLERAKADLIDLVDELKGDRAGLMAFRKKAITLCPLTTDYAFLRQSIDYLSVNSAPRGETDIADAITKALDVFKVAQSSHNAIILISDGEDLAGRAVQAAERAGEEDVPIFTVGIGSTEGITINDEDGAVSFKGEAIKTQLTEQTLVDIADRSNGQYIPLATAGTARTTLGAIYRRHLRKLADIEQQEKLNNQIQERYTLLLIPSILLFMVAAILSQGRLHSSRKPL